MNSEQRILKLLKRRKKGISKKELIEKTHTLNVGGRILDLRKKGYNIITETKDGKNFYGEPCRYGMYKLVEL